MAYRGDAVASACAIDESRFGDGVLRAAQYSCPKLRFQAAPPILGANGALPIPPTIQRSCLRQIYVVSYAAYLVIDTLPGFKPRFGIWGPLVLIAWNVFVTVS